MIADGELVLYVSPKGKRYLRRLDPRDPLHTHDGKFEVEDVRAAGFGGRAASHLGIRYLILRPTLYDLCKNLKRQTQIIYPKDLGYIMMRLSVGPGARVVEAGSGSGSMTTALAWFVGPTGKVYTYERREEFKKLCGRNLAWAGLDDGRVEQCERDIALGFDQTDADALFLDVRTPWEYLEQAHAAVKVGAPMAFLLPTMNQVADLVRGLQDGPFMDVEVLEILVRRWKPVPDRMRPTDRMVAHTTFLVFCRAAPEGMVGGLTAAQIAGAAAGSDDGAGDEAGEEICGADVDAETGSGPCRADDALSEEIGEMPGDLAAAAEDEPDVESGDGPDGPSCARAARTGDADAG